MWSGSGSLNPKGRVYLLGWFSSEGHSELLRHLRSQWRRRPIPGLDCDDALQEVELGIWQQINRCRGRTSEELSSWLGCVASRKLKDLRCLASRRYARTSRVKYIDEVDPDSLFSAISLNLPPGQALEEAERGFAIQRARQCLTELEAQAIELFFFKELGVSDVARKLKVTTHAIHRRIHSGCERLRAYFCSHPYYQDMVP